MPSIPGEHNVLDRATAAQTAERLLALFDPAQAPPRSPATEDSLGSPHLVGSLDEAPLQAIEPVREDINVYAVDGGSSVLARGGNVEVIAWRAGMVAFCGRKRVSENCPPPRILAYNRLETADLMAEFIVDLPVEYSSDRHPLQPVDDLRRLEEWRLIEKIIDDADPGSLLFIDGSLRGDPTYGFKFQRDLLRRAAQRQVHVAAVTKTSSLSLGGVLPLDLSRPGESRQAEPCAYWYRQLNRPLEPNSGWLGNIFLAGLHPGADKPYRVDINRFDEENVDKIFALMAGVSDDVEFCGYPYPLAAAHRLARIDNYFREDIIGTIGRELESRNFSTGLWEYLTGDIHDKLNADLQARDNYHG